ncbi:MULTISPECIES: hypothetical protein [Spirulina sp. CCY15215]|uniref:hypothetical protein n=1 Tax=Spirulina sp. CCY15215 TaxID=2767591 RepID=UPI001951D37D|nr:hypothetical protein [Spirulina major]
MFTKIRQLCNRLCNRFFNKSRNINNEPINKVSLIVVIIIDIFILINVFSGLDDIGRWYLNPSLAHPCYFEWVDYRDRVTPDKDYDTIRSSLQKYLNFQENYQQSQRGHLGNVSATCLAYGTFKDKINTAENQQLSSTIDQKQTQINNFEITNRNIREQYDSTLLEKIAGQQRDRSINLVDAEKAKQELEQNNSNIATLKVEISALKKQLLGQSDSINFLTFLNQNDNFTTVEKEYNRASFWYPSIQIAFQSLFLLPLIFIALTIHKFSERKGYGLIRLMSWHLLVIFFIPLIIKIFQFLQVGIIFQFLFDLISTLLGGFLFLINYVYILLIPAIGFGIIQFFQKIVFNPKIQAANRVQQLRCIQCAKKLRLHDPHCPHCGYYQYAECTNCHNLTYKRLSYCKECGASQNLNDLN